jgi:uncharacterized protein
MKKTMGLAVLALAVAASAAGQAPAPAAGQAPAPAAGQAPAPSPGASPGEWTPGEPPAEMTTYYFVMLVKGPKWTSEPSPERMKLHLAHLRSMWEAKKMVVAGPLLDDGNTRGLCVYKVGSAEEAKALASEDPAVKSGHLAVEVHPWMVQKGILP